MIKYRFNKLWCIAYFIGDFDSFRVKVFKTRNDRDLDVVLDEGIYDMDGGCIAGNGFDEDNYPYENNDSVVCKAIRLLSNKYILIPTESECIIIPRIKLKLLYKMYVKEWRHNHKNINKREEFPVCFEEWVDNELSEGILPTNWRTIYENKQLKAKAKK